MATSKQYIYTDTAPKALAMAIDKADVEAVKRALKDHPNLEVVPQDYLPPLFQVVQRLNGFSIVEENGKLRPVKSRDEWLQEDKAKQLLEIFQLLLAQNPDLNMKCAHSTLFEFMDGGCQPPRLHHPAREPFEKAIEDKQKAAKTGTRTQPSGTMLNQFPQAHSSTTAATTPQQAETPKQMLTRLKGQYPGAQQQQWHQRLKSAFPREDSTKLWLLCWGIDTDESSSVQLSVSGSSSSRTIQNQTSRTSNSSQYSVRFGKRS